MKNRIFLKAAVLVGLAVASIPAQAADTYVLDPNHTQVAFSIDRFGFTNVMAAFGGVEGTVTLDTDNPGNSTVEATIPITGLQATHDVRNQHLTGENWLNAAEYPVATFESTAVEQTGEQTAEVTGMLTLMGVSQPVTLSVTLNKTGQDPATQRQAAGFSATTRLTRSDFGLDTAKGLIGDEVRIHIEALALAPE